MKPTRYSLTVDGHTAEVRHHFPLDDAGYGQSEQFSLYQEGSRIETYDLSWSAEDAMRECISQGWLEPEVSAARHN
jgi:hypothetical protein